MSRRAVAMRPIRQQPAIARRRPASLSRAAGYRRPVRVGSTPSAPIPRPAPSPGPGHARSLNRLRREGFGVSPAFARALPDLTRRGVWIDATTFRHDFRRAPRFRLRAPGNVRVAIIRGRGFLYWWPWWMGVGPILVGVMDPDELPQLDQIDPSADPEDEEMNEVLEVLLPWVPQPDKPIPVIKFGEIKGVASYNKGLRQLAGRDQTGGNTALLVYDKTGKTHLQVFEPGPSGHRITWDATLGQPRKLPPYRPGTAPFGNWMERWIRRVMQLRTGQRFAQKHPNAPGPDLLAAPRGMGGAIT